MFSRIAKLLSFVRTESNGAKVTDVEVDIGGGDNRTAQHFSAPGDDSFPLTTDYVLTSDVARSGSKAAHGYLDPVNDSVAQEGDKRVYGRNAGTGAPVNQVWLKNDGSVLISNDNGSVLLRPDGSIKGANGFGLFELQAGGDMNINGAVIDVSGNITSPGTIVAVTSVSAPLLAAATSLTVNGKEMNNHTHSQGVDSNGDTQVNTNGPV